MTSSAKPDSLTPGQPVRRHAALPMTRAEMTARGWTELDVLLVTGDAYVDHPSFGVAVIGRVLEAAGHRVGIVAQPDWRSPEALTAMGRPRLCCGVTAGNLDSMLANYTAARRHRHDDAYSPGGKPGHRPNHATVVYAQLARRAFPDLPVIIGGIEASLRRVAHYDYWQDKLRPSILCDTQAELLVYGMGEAAIVETARRLAAGQTDLSGIRGTARLLGATAARALKDSPDAGVVLPSFEECQARKDQLIELTRLVELEQNPFAGRRLVQFHGARAVVIEPPQPATNPEDLDRIYALPYTRLPHPSYRESIPAYAMIKDSVTIVRGCAGGCSFCGLGLHQGKLITSRTEKSVLDELARLSQHKDFRGTVSDLGGPTANMYGCRNGVAAACRVCRRPSCLYPQACPHFVVGEEPALRLLRLSRKVSGVKHVFVSSGIRMDLAMRTPAYLRELIHHHVSGHLKVAPEHLHPEVLRRMRKPAGEMFQRFSEVFERESKAAGKEQYLVPYFISNFPGCTESQMAVVESFLRQRRWQPQQVQDYIPLPMTPAAAMYYTGLDYESGQPIPVVRGLAERRPQQEQLRGPRDHRHRPGPRRPRK